MGSKVFGISGLERRVSEQLNEEQVKYEYEPEKFEWRDKNPRGYCSECGGNEVFQPRTYTPDFRIGSSIYLEVKGRLTRRDRKILLGVRDSNPDLDLRLVFDKNNKLDKRAKTRYTEWAERYGFMYSLGGIVPETWLAEAKGDV